MQIHCTRCNFCFDLPDELDNEAKEGFAWRVRAFRQIEAIQFLRNRFPNIGLPHSKALVYHLTTHPRFCHRCGHELNGESVTVCANCRSVNFDW